MLICIPQCRLEQWSFMGVHGVYDMYLADSDKGGLIKLDSKEGWLAQSIRVMDGNFTVESDKDTLVDVILGLYGFNVVCGKDEGDLQALIDLDKANIFPERYFGDLLTRMERELDQARKESGSIFTERDFEQILHAREAFSRIHGKRLSPELSKRLTKRRFSGSESVPPVDSCHGLDATTASSSIAQIEVEVKS